MTTVQQLIQQFGLERHPEGGWYRQTYKSEELITASALPERYGGDRSFSTAIYFLLEKGDFSAFHRIQSDECWHFYTGDPLLVYVIKQNGQLDTITLGKKFTEGQQFQFVVPANSWFASRPAAGSEYCLVGCTVAPGFDFADFELAKANKLIAQYPQHSDLVRELCR